ncbi:MAG: ShlB/FhaC/HecB family hemolysin secretion/activation protein [Cyanobacteriota bacterium]|nr:ShlB/FhaC/HecB family hemolysin secretion/activation protein [Cyanobacteriota bacterium]
MSEKSKFNSPFSLVYCGILLGLGSSVSLASRVEAIASPTSPPKGDKQEIFEAQGTVVKASVLPIARDSVPSPPLNSLQPNTPSLSPSQTAQVPIPTIPPNVPPTPEPPSTEPLPELDPPRLPPPEELLQPGTPIPSTPTTDDAPKEITVNRFEVIGSTILSEEDVAQLTVDYTNRPISFSELLQVRSLITEYYLDRGYITTGALIPPQELTDGTVQIQVVEGGIEEINVEGTRRLNPGYVTSRLGLAANPPLKIERLREALQLLQLDPLIENISAELSSGTRTGFNILDVTVTEAETFNVDVVLNNSRSPNVGSFRRGVEVSEGNLLGIGDRISASYFNTDGSNSLDLSYTVPFNPRNGTVRFAFGTSLSRVIDPTFEVLDISSRSRYYELTLRQPVIQTPAEELALGLTFSRQESQTALGILPDLEGFPISPGADNEGRTKVSAVRFFQEWVKRSERQAIALRSQFSLGVDWLDATENPEPPDSHFVSWRGQGQWVRLLAPDTLFLLRTDLQFSDRPLLALEQFGLGGIDSVRGYRQDFLLADSGWFASAEARIPVLRVPSIDGVLQVAPFFDFGLGWNRQQDDSFDTLAGIGLGLRWNQGDRLQMRLDWGLPLTEVNLTKRTWQDHGLYFSVRYSLF